MGTIVVGTDGSKNASAALQWAADFARTDNSSLRVVHVWHYPYAGSEGAAFVLPPIDDLRGGAEAVLDRALSEVDLSGIAVERVVREGNAVNELIDAARNADLLVVGKRGHGGFLGLLLGSVASQVVRHCPIPVIVVPTE